MRHKTEILAFRASLTLCDSYLLGLQVAESWEDFFFCSQTCLSDHPLESTGGNWHWTRNCYRILVGFLVATVEVRYFPSLHSLACEIAGLQWCNLQLHQPNPEFREVGGIPAFHLLLQFCYCLISCVGLQEKVSFHTISDLFSLAIINSWGFLFLPIVFFCLQLILSGELANQPQRPKWFAYAVTSHAHKYTYIHS